MPDLLDNSSDYGSDFASDEEALLNNLVARVTAEHAIALELEDLQSLQPAVTIQDIEDYDGSPPYVRVPKVLGKEKPGSPWRKRSLQAPAASLGVRLSSPTPCGAGAASVEHPSSPEGRDREREKDFAREQKWIQAAQYTTDNAELSRPADHDELSPIERFRRPPNKAFSVSDLIAPAWCELQYWYTLTKHGRKKRTPAMMQGSVIHKSLEDEIYTTVPVEITTKEDAWALRVWNVIQGLRTLREYGITRELEVWGLVDGELVNGVIDQLSYECPDPELEATAAEYYADAESARAALPEYQMSLTDYLLAPAQGGKRLSEFGITESDNDIPSEDVKGKKTPEDLPPEVYDIRRIYLTDIKTKGKGSAPSVKSSSFRPTIIQLQMYYHMLNRLITSDDVTIELLASRYNFDPHRVFTDAFIAEVGGLNDQFFDARSSEEFDEGFTQTPQDATQRQRQLLQPDETSFPNIPPASQDSTSILLAHNNLASLWNLMKEQLRLTFLPPPISSEKPTTTSSISPSIPSTSQPSALEPYSTTLSPLLTARFLSSAPTMDVESKVLGNRSVLFDPALLTSYVSDQLEWWRGGRNPRGVEIMEAWKCRICEFRDECTWRQEREWAFANRKRGRRSASAV